MLMASCLMVMHFGNATFGVLPPTRMEILAYVSKCRQEKVDIDLVGRFGKDFQGLDLRGVDLSGGYWTKDSVIAITNWRGADLTGTKLEESNLHQTVLDGANLSNTRLRGANLTSCRIAGARLDGVDLRGASLEFVEAQSASLKGANLSGTDISRAVFDQADLTKAILRGVRCQYGGPSFRSAVLVAVDFEQAKLPNADFTDANLTEANLRAGTFPQADFTHADLSNAEFAETDIEYAIFSEVVGVSKEEQRQLQSRSGRWRFEVQCILTNVLGILLTLAYFLLPPFLAITIGIRELRVATNSSRRWFGVFAVVMNVVILAFPTVVLIFRFFGSPVAQLNYPNTMDAWRFWGQLWPALMNCLTGLIIVAVIFAIFSLIQMLHDWRNSWMMFVCALLSILHAVLQWCFVWRFAPTA